MMGWMVGGVVKTGSNGLVGVLSSSQPERVCPFPRSVSAGLAVIRQAGTLRLLRIKSERLDKNCSTFARSYHSASTYDGNTEMNCVLRND